MNYSPALVPSCSQHEADVLLLTWAVGSMRGHPRRAPEPRAPPLPRLEHAAAYLKSPQLPTRSLAFPEVGSESGRTRVPLHLAQGSGLGPWQRLRDPTRSLRSLRLRRWWTVATQLPHHPPPAAPVPSPGGQGRAVEVTHLRQTASPQVTGHRDYFPSLAQASIQ